MTGAVEVVAGVDIGGTTTQVVLCAADLRVVDRVAVPTPAAEGGGAMTDAALDAVRLLLGRTPARLLGVGVGAAGVVDARAGRILVASDSFRDWAGFPVTAAVQEGLGVPAYLDNDVNAFLRGEAVGGAAAGEPHVLGMTLGTGVGGALWLDGRLYDGPHGAAGEIGHVPGFGDLPCTCGGRGHLETLASGRAIAARYAERVAGSEVEGVDRAGPPERAEEAGRGQLPGRVRESGQGRGADRAVGLREAEAGGRAGEVRPALSARAVAELAARGDQDALAVFEAAGVAVARAVLVTAGLLDVTSCVVGGGVSRAWSLLEPPLLAALAAEPPVSGHPVRVRPALLGDDAVAIGAAARARAELGVVSRV
ncbi:ROK family protein [Streptomyces purpurascens]|uniref:ROK family protein n=1 Tax=Streptomyces purpurascens TaxID=1924 RepID=UPI0016730397|nr:ROK family protein [Streptomyces purpurascens]MCE7045996.1 ROK family protein [Streptomyces purpurascens]GGZ97972.1 sugar kinase [Streptomyces purpurascens]